MGDTPSPRPSVSTTPAQSAFPSLLKGRTMKRCEECSRPIPVVRQQRRTRKRFCSEKCRLRARDRRRYAEDPEREREKSRRYYAANRERVIARVRARASIENGRGQGSDHERAASRPATSILREKRSPEDVGALNPWAPSEKRCTSCSRWLPLEDFPLNARMHWGRSSHCRECAREATRDWRARNRERVNAERRRAYRVQNPLPIRACVVCGRSFAKRPDALVCGRECRRRRKLEKQRAKRDRSRTGSS